MHLPGTITHLKARFALPIFFPTDFTVSVGIQEGHVPLS